MPCYDSRTSPEYIAEDYRHNSPVAEMLCAMTQMALMGAFKIEHIPGLKEWWAEHQARDAAKAAE